MRIYSWNVNGLRAVAKKNFLEWIGEENPDILCIQETKLQENQLEDNIKNIDGYYSYFSFAHKKGYSGVATYTKEEPISVKHGIGIERFDSEGRILITEFKDFILLNIYFPNGQRDEERLQYKLDFYEALFNYCDELVEEGKKLVICGDYNTAHNEIDLKNPKANEKASGFLRIERDWLDKIIERGYIDTFRNMNPDKIKYSWWSYRFKARERNAGWRIDYHFVSNNLLDRVENTEILNEVYGSDHCPVMLELE
ncbi:exodeoxyribonuclease III [Clostridium sporogenes]|jgi:exodeoxyribonuclease-3|uniref:Exodeoxyribonuclease III n=2 Tax=Clostridium TaxID=1485 RepID=A0AAE5C8C5_CLOSG|nr:MULTISPECIES: exodeoxyribonuclease III [Clostridium]MBE6076343.1 exodeoxyribonuclease III [Clostridium lundense]MDU2830985.1 exodeoxyribonuclease III [Clostridium botulinum]EDU37296.1 exodeoxyribonuclease III [Clostridium sporogenes ATCC 15579]KIS23490.1 exodeoxyribonuclease III [Clostridium botulinum B2 450]MCW6094033.1 exodeoxyribonuclease III [Clostridium sporogenes]